MDKVQKFAIVGAVIAVAIAFLVTMVARNQSKSLDRSLILEKAREAKKFKAEVKEMENQNPIPTENEV